MGYRTLRGGAVVARQAHNLKAKGSIPFPATNFSSSLAEIANGQLFYNTISYVEITDFLCILKQCGRYLPFRTFILRDRNDKKNIDLSPAVQMLPGLKDNLT